ncbi:hypothetical protein QBC42DRAFT_259738 [Cladorrhinum samala]|uniref:MARVEL domain-containing protein n=1 Tax=Cladorrhinum samala TaxID=585594 RepID=A0AAV9HZC3_9PEZI|nr:hypothetical protein QBC42DRAFT_259738 [Cladorrhinum samala]
MSSSETTPLLNPESAAEPGVHGPVHLPLHNGGGDAGTDSRPDPRGRDRYLFLRIGHWTNLVLAPTVAALAITVDTIYEGGHPRDYSLPWCIQQSMDLVIFWSVISLVCSAGNLVRYGVSKTLLFPDILALAFHFLVGAYLGVTAIEGLSNLTRPYGQCVKGGIPTRIGLLIRRAWSGGGSLRGGSGRILLCWLLLGL